MRYTLLQFVTIHSSRASLLRCSNTSSISSIVVLLSALTAGIASAADGSSLADPAGQTVQDPILVPIDRTDTADLAALPAHPPLLQNERSVLAQPVANHDANLALDIRYTDGRILNPSTGRFDAVHLRSYVAEGAPPNAITPFVAPTISIRPGETVRIKLHNQLPPQPGCATPNINTPHCFNSTNLHSHGLWVSPTGNSDNVLLTIRPNVSFEYEYNIPATHPAGTFWYHPHLHGSTALQVSSGMAGALIVRGARSPVQTPSGIKTGDIDTLLRDASGNSFKERLVLFQQVQYACRDANGKIKVKKNSKGEVVAWICDPGDIGTIEGVDGSGTGYDQFGPSSWAQSGRYTSINGRIMPRFRDVVAGSVERWRTIHAGVRNTINLQFVPMRKTANPSILRSLANHAAWIAQNCVGETLMQWEIATDGLTHSQIIRKSQNVLQPGYRSDMLMVFPNAGDYCVIDAAAPANATIGALAESRQLLGTVRVLPGQTVSGDIGTYLTQQLMTAAQRWMPADVKQTVSSDLADQLKLNAFIPHSTIEDAELTPHSGQSAVFNIDINQKPAVFMVNGKAYDPHTTRDLILGNVEEWKISSDFDGHPFHIHVNPFQVSRILNPQGVDVSVSGEADDPQYANLKGIWKDTLFVKQGYTLYVRTRYERYIGEYVLHCHILDHEDQGMMQNVRMLLPDGEGGAVTSHH